MASFVRSAFAVVSFAFALSPLFAQTPAPATPPPSGTDAEGKLAIALRSYSLLDAEADKLRAANAKLTAEKAALEAKLAEVQAAIPVANQAAGLRDQLRQTQAQMIAYAEENAQLRNKLAALGDSPRGNTLSPVALPTSTPATAVANTSTATSATPAAPAPQRTHVVVAGDTLSKISQTYYGTPNRWNEIREANHLRDEKSLIIGRTLVIP